MEGVGNMEETLAQLKHNLEWVMKIGGTMIGILITWSMWLHRAVSSNSKAIAVNDTADQAIRAELLEMKADLRSLTRSIEGLNNAITKWRTDDRDQMVRMEKQYGTIEKLNSLVANYEERDKAQQECLKEMQSKLAS